MKKDQYKLIIGALLIAVVSFFAGTKYQLSKSAGSTQTAGKNSIKQNQLTNSQSQKSGSQTTPTQGGMPQGGQQGGGMVSGEITAIDDQSITIKSSDGSTKIVIIADSTSYKKSIDASSGDLSVGENVNVVGSSNSDGSITAKNVVLGVVAEPIGQGRPSDSQ